MYKLYSIDKYAGKTKKFIDTQYTEHTLINLIKELDNDRGYHMRILAENNYILFGDCDNFEGSFSSFAKLLITFLDIYYDINITDNNIYYTKNNTKKGSFHYSIPKLYASCAKLKEIHTNFKNVYKHINNIVDTTIYTNKWFRYPNQSKENNDTVKHIIKKGTMKHFIVEYIPPYSVCINDKIFKVEQKNFKYKLLENILSGINTYDDLQEWTAIGMALKNESCDDIEFFDLWDKWSSQSVLKYDGTVLCKKKWGSFKKMNGYSIQYLLKLLKTQNNTKYKEIKKIIDIQKVLKDNKWCFPNNKCIIDKLDSKEHMHSLVIADEHCPIYENIHNEHCQRMFEINDRGTACMKCTHTNCINKICPTNGIAVPKNIIKKIFVVNNVVINNYGKTQFDIRLRLSQQDIIYEDTVLNTLMIKCCIYGHDESITDAIAYLYKDSIRYVENIWYMYSNIWIECDIINDVILKFIVVFDTIKNYIINSTNIYEVEKREHMDQLNCLLYQIKNPKKNKSIISLLQKKMYYINMFDKNNLIAFNNGVYDFEQIIFRDIVPQDNIRKKCNYNYSDKYINKQSLLDFLNILIPNSNILNNFLLCFALSLCKRDNMIFILKFCSLCYRNKFINLINETFGEYCNIIDNIANNKIVEQDIWDIINNKKLTLFICFEIPLIELQNKQNIGYINITNNNYIEHKIYSSDLFLLLTEQLFLNNTVNKSYFAITTQVEQICIDFINDCVERSDDKIKCSDMYDAYKKWNKSNKILSKTSLFTQLKKYIQYKKSVRCGEIFMSMFINVRLK